MKLILNFLSDGRDIVLPGKQFKWNDKNKKPHMKEEYTIDLAEKILLKYKEHWERYPQRVVIHKSSYFTTEEERGFSFSSSLFTYNFSILLFYCL